jgi:hypothetical protein
MRPPLAYFRQGTPGDRGSPVLLDDAELPSLIPGGEIGEIPPQSTLRQPRFFVRKSKKPDFVAILTTFP